MAVFTLLNNSCIFPQPELADEDGLLAIGGDLSSERLLNAYSNGIFPWYNPSEPICWWCPKKRYVIFPSRVHISRSMRKMMRRTSLQVKFNYNFPDVMSNCRKMREGETWINPEMEIAYNRLFEMRHALCVGVYENDILVGGLYGVVIGRCFYGESMFSKVADASKLALVRLCELLKEHDFVFVDCQFHTEHLESMGGEYISWGKYKNLLATGLSGVAVVNNLFDNSPC